MTHKKKRNWIRIFSIGIMATTIPTAIYIMIHHLGLVDELDFGAGAYYYADIPNFQKYVNGEAFFSDVPFGVILVVFLVWGALMWKLWTKLEDGKGT